MTTTIKCHCGQVSLRFPSDKPLFRNECMCVDCLDRLVWTGEVRGAPLPEAEAAAKFVKPIEIHYYPNRIEVLEGKDKLKLTTLRKGAAGTTLTTACCTTGMTIMHPTYGTGFIGVVPAICPVADQPKDLGPAMLRCWIKDWPEEALAKLGDGAPGFYIKEMGPEGPVFDGTGDWGAAFGAWSEAGAKPPPDGPGSTIQDLFEELGGADAVEDLGRPEGERSYLLKMAKSA